MLNSVPSYLQQNLIPLNSLDWALSYASSRYGL